MNVLARIVSVLLGLVILAAGAYILINPQIAILTTGLIVGISVVIEGIAAAVMWNSMRKNGVSNGWTLFGAIVSILVGGYVIFNFRAQASVSIIMLYFIAAWLVVVGITKIVQSAKLKRMSDEYPEIIHGAGWGWMLLFGILMVAAGIFSFINPALLLISLGYILAIDLLISGASTVVTSILA